MINTFWPKFFVTCHFLRGILFVAVAAVPVSDALMWLLEEKKLCLFRWYHGESGRQEWMGLTHCGKLIFRRITKVAKNVVWSCDLVQTKHWFLSWAIKLIQSVPLFKSIMTQKHTDVCPPASGPHGGWTADLTSIHIFQFHCTGTNYLNNMCDYTFKNIRSDATWHLTSGGPPDGAHRKLLFVPGPNGN